MKKIASLLVVLAMVLALCSVAMAEPVEIDMWHYFDDTSGVALQKLVDDYNASQDAIHVTVTYQARAELYSQLTMGAMTGELPEIAMIDNPDVAAFIAMGILTDITEYGAEWGEVENFYQGPLGACYADGRLYGLTNNTNCLTLVANMDMLAAAGYDAIPDTFDAFYEMVEKLTDTENGVYGYAMSAKSDEEGTFQMIPWVVAGGANYDSMDTEGAVAAMTLLGNMAANGLMSPECVSWSQGDAMNSFCAGKAAVSEIGTWHLSSIDNSIAEAGTGINYQLFKFPGLESGMSGSCVGGECYAVTTAAAEKGVEKEVVDFLFWLMNCDNNAYFCEVSGKFAARSDSFELVERYSQPGYDVMSDEMTFAVARGPVADWAAISEALYTCSQSVILGSVAPEDACATAAAAIAGILG